MNELHSITIAFIINIFIFAKIIKRINNSKEQQIKSTKDIIKKKKRMFQIIKREFLLIKKKTSLEKVIKRQGILEKRVTAKNSVKI